MDKNFILLLLYIILAKPHMGHAYSSIVSDFCTLKKNRVMMFFLTGTDEHGQKIQRRRNREKDPLKFCDENQNFRKFVSLNLSNNDFIEPPKSDTENL